MLILRKVLQVDLEVTETTLASPGASLEHLLPFAALDQVVQNVDLSPDLHNLPQFWVALNYGIQFVDLDVLVAREEFIRELALNEILIFFQNVKNISIVLDLIFHQVAHVVIN